MNGNGGTVFLQHVQKVYRMGRIHVVALKEISISFTSGSFWAIMGPSGSGKSTLLNLIGCLDRPTAGRYLLDGYDVAALDDDALSDIRLRRIGFVFQGFNLIPELTVHENIELPMYYGGMNAAASERRVHDLAERVGLADRLAHRPSELSGGQQQRVAIARALANEPSLILADEPTGNLDSVSGGQIMRILEELNGQGKTVIMVTHDPGVASHARMRLHMRDGAVEAVEEAV